MRKAEIASLTGLRFMAALSILLLHATSWCTPFNDSQSFTKVGSFVGVYGMPLFFVLSGFVIHYNYGALFRTEGYPSSLRTFFVARFARVYPLYIFLFACGALIDFTVNWIAGSRRAFLSYIFHGVTLTQSWVYKLVVNGHLLLDTGSGLSWSISSELFFYFAYVVFVFAVLMLRRPLAAIAATVALSIVVLGALVICFFNADALMAFAQLHVRTYLSVEQNWPSSFYRWFFYFSPYVRIWEFALGCLTAQIYITVQDRMVSSAEYAAGIVLVGTALLAIVAFQTMYAFDLGGSLARGLIHFFALNFGLAAPIAVIIFCAARYQTAISKFLSLPWIVYLGDISYSIYAVHTWTLRPFIRPSVSLNLVYGIDAILRLTFGIAFTLIVATATYAIIEVPCRRYLRAKLGRQPRPAPKSALPLAAPAAEPT